MKKTLMTLVLACSTLAICSAQKIEMKKSWGAFLYTQNGETVSMRKLVKVMETNPEALNYMKKARSNNTFANILGGAGGALIGWPIGTAIGGGDANWALAGVGAGLVIVGIPIASSAHKNGKKAVELYNASLDATSYTDFKPTYKLIANGNGIGLSMNF